MRKEILPMAIELANRDAGDLGHLLDYLEAWVGGDKDKLFCLDLALKRGSRLPGTISTAESYAALIRPKSFPVKKRSATKARVSKK